MLMRDVDFDALVGRPKAAGLIEKLLQRFRKIALIRNWSQFVTPFAPSVVPQTDLIPVLFRNGMILYLRADTQDIAILHEVFLERAYASLERILKQTSLPITVIDLGAHIGCFALRSLWAGPNVFIECYEPGDHNREALTKNVDSNRSKADRVKIYGEAVASDDGTARYFHDPTVTVNSGLYGESGGVEITTVSFKTVLSRCRYPVALLKIDIEGAEYELLDGTVPDDWNGIPAIMAETHPDPSGESNPQEWLRKMYDLGFRRQSREYSTVLLQRI
jgi:FkbM family methyltransferase